MNNDHYVWLIGKDDIFLDLFYVLKTFRLVKYFLVISFLK